MDKIDVLTTDQVARSTGRTVSAIQKMAARRGLGMKIGGTWFFTHDDVRTIGAIDKRGGRPRHDGTPVAYKGQPIKDEPTMCTCECAWCLTERHCGVETRGCYVV